MSKVSRPEEEFRCVAKKRKLELKKYVRIFGTCASWSRKSILKLLIFTHKTFGSYVIP